VSRWFGVATRDGLSPVHPIREISEISGVSGVANQQGLCGADCLLGGEVIQVVVYAVNFNHSSNSSVWD